MSMIDASLLILIPSTGTPVLWSTVKYCTGYIASPRYHFQHIGNDLAFIHKCCGIQTGQQQKAPFSSLLT